MKMQHMTKQNLQLEVTLRTRIKFFFRGLFIRGFYPGTLKHAPKVGRHPFDAGARAGDEYAGSEISDESRFKIDT